MSIEHGPSTNNLEENKLNVEVESFFDISDDNWDELVTKGVPLYERLKNANNSKATEVRNQLTNLKLRLENSGAGDPDVRAKYISRIEMVLR